MALPLIIAGAGLLLGGASFLTSLLGGGGDNQALEQAKYNYFFNSQLLEAERKLRKEQLTAEWASQEKVLNAELALGLKAAALSAMPSTITGPDWGTIEAGKVNAAEKREETIRVIHALDASYGAAGVKGPEGSALQVMQDTAREGAKDAANIEYITWLQAQPNVSDSGKGELMAQLERERILQAYDKEMTGMKLSKEELARREAFEAEWAAKGKIYAYYAMQSSIQSYSDAYTISLMNKGSSLLTSFGQFMTQASNAGWFSGSYDTTSASTHGYT